MAATVWKGQLTFGLISIPIKLFRAARAERVPFHRLNRANGSRVRQHFVSEVAPEVEPEGAPEVASGPEYPVQNPPRPGPRFLAAAEIHAAKTVSQRVSLPSVNEPRLLSSAAIVKGYEFEKNRYVTLEPEELETITQKTSGEMEIVEFVKLAEIDPVYLETSYYAAPDRGGEKPYSMLFGALRKTGYVALARVAMHNREHVAILRPGSKGILMHTLYFAQEVRRDQEFPADTSPVSPKEMDLAVMLIEALAAAFEPEKFKDTYREKLQALIDAKVRGETTAKAPEPTSSAEVIDIVAALRNSLELVRKPVNSAETSHSAAPSKTRKRRASGN